MGTCDTVPGISGGTIAFITGIYIRLIEAVKSLTKKENLKLLYKFKISKFFKKSDLKFLFILLAGILLAIFTISSLIDFLLHEYLAYTLSFFVGLIIASSKIIYKDIGKHTILNILFAIVGTLIGLSLLLFSTTPAYSPSYIFLLFSGFIAVSALFLPGISGSFILLILGSYDYVISAVKSPLSHTYELATIGVGAVIGAVTISRVIDFLYRLDKSKTLYTLLGLVIGSLAVPITRIKSDLSMQVLPISISLALLLLGYALVELLQKEYKFYNKS